MDNPLSTEGAPLCPFAIPELVNGTPRGSQQGTVDNLPSLTALLLHGSHTGRRLAVRTLYSIVSKGRESLPSAVVEQDGCLDGLFALLEDERYLDSHEVAAAAICSLTWIEKHRLLISAGDAATRIVSSLDVARKSGRDEVATLLASAISNLAISSSLHRGIVESTGVATVAECLSSTGTPALRIAAMRALKVKLVQAQAASFAYLARLRVLRLRALSDSSFAPSHRRGLPSTPPHRARWRVWGS